MPEEIKNQVQAKRRGRLWIGLAIGLVLLVGLIALGGCSKKSAGGSNTKPGPETVVKNSIGMEFAFVPAGSFQMGSNNPKVDERPIHQVTFAQGFYMGRYEVTQAQWQKMTADDNRLSFKNCGDNCPVGSVSWDDAQEFIKKLNAANDGYTYRLPSEAEWEYACRAGTTGNQPGDPDSIAWYKPTSNNTVHPVGQKQPNAWALYDMLGNEEEWVMDYYHETYDGAPTDGSAWLNGGEQKYRVVRGGEYTDNIYAITSSARTSRPGSSFGGLRLVAVPRS